jgi:hypothetical protein
LVKPDTISSRDLDIFSFFERNLMHNLLADPSTGGAVSFIFKAPSCSPTMVLFERSG